jgi:hypothetical protein
MESRELVWIILGISPTGLFAPHYLAELPFAADKSSIFKDKPLVDPTRFDVFLMEWDTLTNDFDINSMSFRRNVMTLNMIVLVVEYEYNYELFNT